MGETPTARDRVWATIIKLEDSRFTVEDVKENLPAKATERPELAYGSAAADESTVSEETIKRVLRAGTELGVIDHTSGSKYYEKKITKTVQVEETY